jgi:hypothetical protein
VASLSLEHVHNLADLLNRELCILGLVVPDLPVQPLDLFDDEGLRFYPAGLVGQQPTRRQFRMLEALLDVEPIQD